MLHWEKNAGMVTTEEVNRMRWAARRGMLELDLVLEPFVVHRYAQLEASDRQLFAELMRSEDQDLFSWFLQRETPENQEFAALVGQILAFTHTAPADR